MKKINEAILKELDFRIQELRDLAEKHIIPHTGGYEITETLVIRAGGNVVHRPMPLDFLEKVRDALKDSISSAQ